MTLPAVFHYLKKSEFKKTHWRLFYTSEEVKCFGLFSIVGCNISADIWRIKRIEILVRIAGIHEVTRTHNLPAMKTKCQTLKSEIIYYPFTNFLGQQISLRFIISLILNVHWKKINNSLIITCFRTAGMFVMYIYKYKSKTIKKLKKNKNNILRCFVKKYWNRNQITFYGDVVKYKRIGERRSVFGVLVGMSEGKRTTWKTQS
jgi:hypothetical protein